MKPVLQKQKTKKDLDLQKILQVPVFFSISDTNKQF